MASVKFVAVSRGLSGILDYVTNREKTTDALITGVNCVAQMARDEFEAVKKQFHKTDGRGYYHIVQSFSPDDPLDFKTAHEIGIKFAEYFQGYQCVVATHMNTDHIHNHIVMNSVNFETGRKFHQSAREMQQAKEFSNQLCLQYGLSVTETKADPNKISAWKKKLRQDIKRAMELCYDREQFINCMEAWGYGVKWEDGRRHITYTTPENMRCRDSKLFDQTFLRENMEHYFAMGGREYLETRREWREFDRPEFKRMIDDIETGKINMVIVKNLSRFGREYAQMGMYIEHYFEEKGVRFISVAENIDSKNGIDNLVLPFTNVINSFYARQASSKTKAAKEARAKSGMFLGSHAPFGYVKDPNDRHHLIVDPPAAEVVKEIFKLFADGVGYVRMTKILRERGVLNPQAYFNQNNPDYYKNSDYWRKPYDWHATSIRVILNNPVYLGKVVYGRSKQKGFFDKRREEVPEDEWIVTENAHEPLISQELWDTVHQMMKARRRENGSHEVQPFAGLVKCASCGSSLNVSYDKKRRRYTGFSCWVYKNYGKERCTSHAIGWKALNQLVLEDIRRNAQAAKLASEDYKNMLISMRMEKKAKEIGRCKRELKKADKRVAELEKILTKLYEDAALGKISEERYQSMAAAYEREQGVLKDQREALSAEIAQGEEVYQNVEYFLPLIQKYTDITELNAHILNELIEKIVVHEKQIDEDGIKSQQVDIYYKFIGYINMKELLINGVWCVQDTPEGQKLTLVKLA